MATKIRLRLILQWNFRVKEITDVYNLLKEKDDAAKISTLIYHGTSTKKANRNGTFR